MEVLQTKPLTELVKEVTIKVCQVSDLQNDNGTVINYETSKIIGSSLPGAPIVGFFNEQKNDFENHNRKLIIEDGKLKWKTNTRPYGFVSPLKSPWLQDFIEDGVTRTYLLCIGYLWTKQFPEADFETKGQSMELSDEYSGYYEGDVFIFTEATISKLCILGDDVPPCFEGATIASSITDYSKEYANMAKDLENIIGRGYCVLNDTLVKKDEEVIESAEVLTDFSKAEEPKEEKIESELEVGNGETGSNDEGSKPEAEGEVVSSEEGAPATEFSVGVAPTEGNSSNTITWTANVNPSLDFSNTFSSWTVPMTIPEEVNLSNFSNTASNIDGFFLGTSDPTQIDPSLDFSKTISNLNERITSLEEMLSEKEQCIENLQASLTAYQLKEQEEIKVKKEEMFTTYSALLSEEEMAPIREAKDELKLEDIEAKLSIAYSRKQMDSIKKEKLQVNIGAVDLEEKNDEIPSFMRKAMEYDRNHI